MNVRLAVNGQVVQRSVDVRMTLADFLREELHLTGTHLGCEQGVCGACSVLMDGRSVRSCLMLAVQADKSTLTTVEGLAAEGLDPVQAAFRDHHALQCGFCTPGFLISTHELLERSPDPSDAEIKEALSGHICRCTGYQNIRAAVQGAAAKRREGGGL